MLNLILFGPPGSGKGTQADNLVKKYDLLHISTGDLFRAEIGNSTPLGLAAKSYMDKGNLVPDSISIGMLRNKMAEHPEVKGFLLDGFPRTVPQAEALDALLAELGESVSQLVALEVADDELVQRLRKRAETSGRTDDGDENIIRNRLHVYNAQTTAEADYYAAQGKTTKIDGVGSVTAIADRLVAAIDAIV